MFAPVKEAAWRWKLEALNEQLRAPSLMASPCFHNGMQDAMHFNVAKLRCLLP